MGADKDATDYFRGIMAIGERSERVLALTEHIIRMNAGHYTVWSVLWISSLPNSFVSLPPLLRSYRYDTLLALKHPLDQELKLMDEITLKHIKYYQVWHHRRLLQTHLRLPAPEINFISKVLATDDKNYHTWAYRQWLLTHFDEQELWEEEWDFVDATLSMDVRNNSAWHHRFFLVFETGIRPGEQDREAVKERELRYVKERISFVPNNPSAWNYLRGCVEKFGMSRGELRLFVEYYITKRESKEDQDEDEEEQDVIDLENPKPGAEADLPCTLALEFMADIYEEEGAIGKATEVRICSGHV